MLEAFSLNKEANSQLTSPSRGTCLLCSPFRHLGVFLKDARRWVNKMCMAAEVPLVESGTTGFLGQVQPIMKVSCALENCRL